MKKKILSLFIVAVMSASFIPVIAHAAANGTCGDSLTWELSDEGTLTVSGSGEMYDYEQGAAPWYKYSAETCTIKKIVVEAGITKIGDYAFYGAGTSTASTPTGDIQLTLPEGVTKISKRAFYNSRISEINLPSTIASLASDSFYGCPMLTAINISENNRYFTTVNGVLFGRYGKILIKYPEAKPTTSYTIPAGVEQIGYAAFYNAASLENISFNSGLKEIRDMGLCYCTSLKSINLPDSLEYIGSAAFAYAGVNSKTVYKSDGSVESVIRSYEIDSVTIPKNVSHIGENAFQNMKEFIVDTNNSYYKSENGALFTKDGTTLMFYPTRKETESYIIPDTVTKISARAFYNAQIGYITMPDSVTEIGSYAFTNSYITGISLSHNLTAIDDYMFNGCINLQSILIPEKITSIGEYAFRNCSSLESIQIPDSVKTIGAYAFNLCTSLKEITIPANVTEIPQSLFQGDSALERVNLPDTLKSIGNYAFYKCTNLWQITLPDNLTDIKDGAFYNCSSLEQIDIPAGVERIGDEAFYNCASLSEIMLNEGLEYIGQAAFYKCPVKSLAFPEGLRYIDEFAFYSALPESINIPDSVEYIGPYAFQNCTNLKSASLSRKIAEIKAGTFSGCIALESLEIYDNINNVAANAFKDCPDLSITYHNGPTMFTEITVSPFGNDAFTKLTPTCIPSHLEAVPTYDDFNTRLSIKKETDSENNELIFTVTSHDSNPLPVVRLFSAQYDGDILEKADVDYYKYQTEDMYRMVLVVKLPETQNCKIMLWDENNTPITDVIEGA